MLTDIDLKGNNGKDRGDPEEAQRPDRARTTTLWVAFALLAVGLLAATGYGYYILRESNIKVSQLPAGLRSIATLSNRVNASEGKLASLTAEWQDLGHRVGELERKTASNLKTANKHAEHLTTELEGRLEAKIDGQAYIDNTRLNELEAKQVSQHAQVAQLEGELASARRELAAAQQNITAISQDTGQRFASLETQASSNARDLSSMSHRLDQRRVDFEVVKNHTYELAQGISFRVTGTNVAYQRVGGWISLAPESRVLWVEQQGIQQPVVFYRQQEGERCELVVTRVGQDAATGYLLLAEVQASGDTRQVSELAPMTKIPR